MFSPLQRSRLIMLFRVFVIPLLIVLQTKCTYLIYKSSGKKIYRRELLKLLLFHTGYWMHTGALWLIVIEFIFRIKYVVLKKTNLLIQQECQMMLVNVK